MQNLLNSTDIATLFLDSALNVRRFTEQITRIVHLREGDIGRPLSELASTLIYPELHVDASHERFTLDHNRCILCTRCVRVCDITAAKELEARLRKA